MLSKQIVVDQKLGTYTRNGQLVTVTGRLVITSLGSLRSLTGSQQVRLAGLPFTMTYEVE